MPILDVANRVRGPQTMAGYYSGRAPANKGRLFPPEPISINDMVKLFMACQPRGYSVYHRLSAMRLRCLMAILWRTGLRISEALDLEPRDLSKDNRAMVVRNGKGRKRRIVAMDEWGWNELDNWLKYRADIPVGKVIPVLRGITAGTALCDADVRRQFRDLAIKAKVNRRIHPHAFRHTCAVDMWREGIPEYVIQQQLGHVRLDVTALYLRGLAPLEVLERVGQRRAPMILITNLINS